jgi:hypothetical protein
MFSGTEVQFFVFEQNNIPLSSWVVAQALRLGPALFPDIGVLPGPATGSHIVNRGSPVYIGGRGPAV